MGRGLHNFIRDLKNCNKPDQELKRVQEELAKIRQKFRSGGELDAYSKKKYVWKLLYVFMLGYEVDFGIIEGVHLLAMPGYAEKSCGYMAVTLLLDEDHDMMQLVINSLRNDLQINNNVLSPEFQCLALGLLSNLGAGNFMEELCPHVKRLMEAENVEVYVKKKAALCLVNMFRHSKEFLTAEDMERGLFGLLESSNVGVCTSAMSLLNAMVSYSTDGWSNAPRVIVTLLNRTRKDVRNFARGYTYFQIPAPWLQIKCLRLLQYFEPTLDSASQRTLDAILDDIIKSTDIKGKNQNKINALHGIFFEAIHLVNHLRGFETATEGEGEGERSGGRRGGNKRDELLVHSVGHLGKFLSAEDEAKKNPNLKQSNVRYLALDTLSRIAMVPGGAAQLRRHQEAFIKALEDIDFGIRRRALDVLYQMADKLNAPKIVEKFLEFLVDAEITVREELVLKVAIMAERFATEFEWYVDVILRLVQVGGAAVSNDIWYRVCVVVTNNMGLHKYAAGKVFEAVSAPNANENMVKISAYLLGEFGEHIADDPGCSFEAQFDVLQSKSATLGLEAKAILLNSYIKMLNQEPALKEKVSAALRGCVGHHDQEVQQRACEYLMMSALRDGKSEEIMDTCFDTMDVFPDRDNPLVKRLLRQATGDDDVTTESEHLKTLHLAKESRHRLESEAGQEEDDARSGDESSEDEDEDYGGGGGAEPAAEPVVAEPGAAEPAVAGVADLLGDMLGHGGDGVGGGSAGDLLGGAVGAGGAQSTDLDTAEIIQRYVTTDKNHIHKDATVTIGAIAQFRPRQAAITLYLQNASASAFTAVEFSVAGSEEVAVAQNAAVPALIVAGQQVMHRVLVQCTAAYLSPPRATLAFAVDGVRRQISFPLPLPINRFCDPVVLQPAAFMSTWKAVNVQLSPESQFVVSPDGGADPAALAAKLTACRFAMVKGLDPNPANLVAASKFSATSGELPVMVRLETHAASGQVRVSLRTTKGELTKGMSALLQTALK